MVPYTLVHLVVAALVAIHLITLMRRSYRHGQQTRRSVVGRLLRHAAMLFLIDFGLALTLVDALWGSSPSARWLTQAVMFFGAIMFCIIVYVPWRHRHNTSRFES